MKPFLTLSGDGGGCNGYGPALIMSLLERWSGRPLHEIFQATGGTSISGITTLGVASNVPAVEVQKFFTKDGAKIFRPTLAGRYLPLKRLFKASKYSAKPLERSLKALLGHYTNLRDCRTRWIGTTRDQVTGKNVYIQSYGVSYEDEDEIVIAPDSGMLQWEAARATSAAQTYFPGFVWRDRVFWDGGFCANNPAMLVYLDSLEVVDPSDIHMLSLGTGRPPWPFAKKNMADPGLVRVLEATIAAALEGPESLAVWEAESIMGKRFFRLNPKIPAGLDMDTATPESFEVRRQIWNDMIARDKRDTLNAVLNLAI
jgi:uncharacterized protein